MLSFIKQDDVGPSDEDNFVIFGIGVGAGIKPKAAHACRHGAWYTSLRPVYCLTECHIRQAFDAVNAFSAVRQPLHQIIGIHHNFREMAIERDTEDAYTL